MGLYDVIGAVLNTLLNAASSSNAKMNRMLDEREKNVLSAESSKEISSIRANEEMDKINKARMRVNIGNGFHRRTDTELNQDTTDTDKNARQFSYEKNVSLYEAVNRAPSYPGVYILMLNGKVMKCGRAAYSEGINWRFTQYYNLNYDEKARAGDLWSVNEKNRDKIIVSWQCCPPSRCQELEFKLFLKYGKGQWAKRAPSGANTDGWELLI